MLRSSTTRAVLAAVLVLVALGMLRYRPWQRAGGSSSGAATIAGTPAGTNDGRQKLTVGFLPVT